MAAKRLDDIDKRIGSLIRSQRVAKGMSQTALAERAGVTFQQIQKYENGANRVSGGRIQQIADALGVPAGFFFGAPKNSERDEFAQLVGRADTWQLLRAFQHVHGASRLALVRIAEDLAKQNRRA